MSLTKPSHILLDALLTLAYPLPCALCGASVENHKFGRACEDCWTNTRVFNSGESLCWKCGQAISATATTIEDDQLSCHRCNDLPFTAARACGVYEGALREAVLSLKREPHVPSHLRDLLVSAARRPPLDLATRIVPVPLHPKRQRVRGFNQASVIASAVARPLGLPLDEGSLCRIRSTEKNRAGLDFKGRRDSVAEAFEVSCPMLVKDDDVLLIDDVFTTGATASSCARALLAAGARNVLVLTIARPNTSD